MLTEAMSSIDFISWESEKLQRFQADNTFTENKRTGKNVANFKGKYVGFMMRGLHMIAAIAEKSVQRSQR